MLPYDHDRRARPRLHAAAKESGDLRPGGTTVRLKAVPRHESADCAALLLGADGAILGGDGSVDELFGCSPAELTQFPLTQLLPDLPPQGWIRSGQFTPQFRFRCRVGCTYKVRPRSGDEFEAALFPSGVGNRSNPGLRLLVMRIDGEGAAHV